MKFLDRLKQVEGIIDPRNVNDDFYLKAQALYNLRLINIVPFRNAVFSLKDYLDGIIYDFISNRDLHIIKQELQEIEEKILQKIEFILTNDKIDADEASRQFDEVIDKIKIDEYFTDRILDKIELKLQEIENNN